MPQSILDIILRTKKEGTGISQANKELGELKNGLTGAIENMTGLSIGSLGTAAVIAGLGAAARECVVDFTNYADEVRNVEMASGLGAGESSRLLQVMDDLKVDAGDLQTVMKFMAKQGIDPSIDSLARLSDQYLTLAPGQERENFLLKEFGKNGVVMAEAMGMGSAKLKEMAAAQSGNLILTQEQVDAARKFQQTQDDLNDTWEGLKVTLGSKLMPVADTFLTFLNNALTAGDRLNQSLLEGSTSYEDYIEKVKAGAVATGNMTQAQAGALAATQALSRGEYEAATAKETYANDFDREALAAKNAAGALDTVTTATNNDKAATDLLNGSMGTYTRQLMFNIASEGLSSAGKIELARAMGLVDEHTYGAIQGQQALKTMLDKGQITLDQYTERSKQLADEQDRLHNVDVTITTNYVETHTKKTATGAQAFASGGSGSFTVPAGWPNDSYPLGGGNYVQSGETVKFEVTPAGGPAPSGGGKGMFDGATINIVSPMTLEMFKQMLVAATK